MHTDYPDAAAACADVALYIRRDFPSAVFELTYHVHGQPHSQHTINHSQELGQTLQRYAARFHGARVFYNPHHPYGMICLIECACGGRTEREGCACDSPHNRSCIAVILHEQDHRPVLVGNRMPPAVSRGPNDTPRPWRAEDGVIR